MVMQIKLVTVVKGKEVCTPETSCIKETSVHAVEHPVATTSPQRPVLHLKSLYLELLMSDHLSSATSFTTQITIFGTSRERPPLLSDQFYNSNHYVWNFS